MHPRVFHGLPDRLLQTPAPALADLLGGPSLIYLEGGRAPPLLLSVLLHGNETSGWDGVRRVLAEFDTLPRGLILFIGNVAAAAAGLRTLPDQQDYNRIWRGGAGPEGELAARILDRLKGQALFAAVDLHNNTGRNPHYAIVTDLSPDNLGLAYLFSDKAVYVREPDTVMTRVFAERCPAVALEVGPVGDQRCEDRVYDYVKRLLTLQRIPGADLEQLQMYRTQVRVHVAPGADFAFAGESWVSGDAAAAPLLLTGGMEAVNFHQVAAGTEFGTIADEPRALLQVLDVDHRNVTDEYFARAQGRLLLKRTVVPAMYTTDPLVVRQDCLCYFMERMPLVP